MGLESGIRVFAVSNAKAEDQIQATMMEGEDKVGNLN